MRPEADIPVSIADRLATGDNVIGFRRVDMDFGLYLAGKPCSSNLVSPPRRRRMVTTFPPATS